MSAQPWRFVTAAFVHGNVVHLLVNCVSLSDIGSSVEPLCGPQRTLAVYVSSAISGNVLSAYLSTSNALGASGAIMGLAGALATVLSMNSKVLGQRSNEVRDTVLRVVAINLAIGALSRGVVDNWGHLGGLFGGAITAYALGPRFRRRGFRIKDEPIVPCFAGTGSLAHFVSRPL